MKNILLINPAENLIEQDIEMYPSGALVLLGTMAHNLGHNVKIVHMVADKVNCEKLKTIVSEFRPDIVGITMNTFQTKNAKEVTKTIKEANENILVVVGGPHPSALKLKIFDNFPYIDVAIIGEGEHTFLEIVGGKDFKEIKGICYKDSTMGLQMTKIRPYADNLDYIPLPNLDLVDFNQEKFIGADPVAAKPAMYIMASRGCPFQCTYCNKSIWGRMTRFRKPELIIEEIKWLQEKYGVREIFFQDDTLNLNREWLERLLNLIIEQGLNKDIVYKAPFRANRQLIDKELLELVKKAGFWLIFYGVENGNQKMLDRMKKALTVEEIKRAFKLTHSVGMKTTASFIIGLPGETKETIRDTYNLWKELNPYKAGYGFAIPFPDTELERALIEKGHLFDRNYDHYRFGVCFIRTDELSKEKLEYFRATILNKMDLIEISRKLKHPIANIRHLREKIIDGFKNPKILIERLKIIIKRAAQSL